VYTCLKNKQKPPKSVEDIVDYVNEHNDFVVSKRTIERDLRVLREQFGIEISFNKSKIRYEISEDFDPVTDEEQLNKLLAMAEMVNKFQDLSKRLLSDKNFIYFAHQQNYGLISNKIATIIKAIRLGQKVEILHQKFKDEKPELRVVEPAAVVEHDSMWFLIGFNEKRETRTFGIDRIQKIDILNQQSSAKKFELQKAFDNCLGVTQFDDEPVDIKLLFTPIQGKYVKSNPLAKSQEIVEDNEAGLLIKLRLVNNFELKAKLLSYGDTVEVLEPKELRAEIAAMHKRSLSKYI
jgi:predicted DNA-binding transcriptional regulator YafY